MMRYSFLCGVFSLLALAYLAEARSEINASNLVERMEKRYEGIKDYQVTIEVSTAIKDGSFDTQTFIYRFKKPMKIRLDFKAPHPGMVLVYPDPKGKVALRPWPLLPFIKMRLELDDPRILSPSGQRIDQTDLGLFIRKLSHSLTDQRRGPARIFQADGTAEIEVLAEDHFRPGIDTLYHFWIDEETSLPSKVEEREPGGRLKRTVLFRDWTLNMGLAEKVFQLN
jgi:hypothetical protein